MVDDIYLGNKGNPWNENNYASLNNSALQELVLYYLVKYHTCSIAETLVWADVSQDHQWHTSFKVKHVRRKSIGLQRIKILNVKSEHILRVF